jgi:hypothetical protein
VNFPKLIDNIMVGFSKPKGGFEPFSWAIIAATKSPFSHAYIKYYDSYAAKWVIYQASGTKVNFMGETMFNSKEDTKAEFIIPISIETKKKVVQYAIDNVGLPYGILKIFGFAWVIICRSFGKKVKNPFSNNNATMVCSELVSCILDEVVLDSDDIDPETATPIDVYNFMVTKGYKRTI